MQSFCTHRIIRSEKLGVIYATLPPASRFFAVFLSFFCRSVRIQSVLSRLHVYPAAAVAAALAASLHKQASACKPFRLHASACTLARFSSHASALHVSTRRDLNGTTEYRHCFCLRVFLLHVYLKKGHGSPLSNNATSSRLR